jgi:hypothetical protein
MKDNGFKCKAKVNIKGWPKFKEITNNNDFYGITIKYFMMKQYLL